MSRPIPILVGVGQATLRMDAPNEYADPVDAVTAVVTQAAEDAGCPALVEKADALHVVNMIAWRIGDPPSTFAEALGMHPTLKEYTAIGGDAPQFLVNRVADNLAAGKSEIAVLVGCEAFSGIMRAAKTRKFSTKYMESLSVPMVGGDRPSVNEVELEHGADMPVRVYPLIENALRAKEGLTLEQQRENLGRFGESFSAVAAKNPYSWSRVARTAQEVVTPTKENRLIAHPYTKYMNALPADMAAAVIMTTTEGAKRMGIPEEKWVYLHGGQDTCDEWFVSNRPDLADSPAIKALADDALAQAGIGLDAVSFFDFYSCFPCMPRLTCRMLGIADDDPRPLTITGGLPYFGGPGSNYVMHSIAEAVGRCRADREAYGLITSNGWYCTKHGVGIYSARPPEGAWERTPPERFQEELSLPEPLEVDLEPSGPFTVDAYTVVHGRDGTPETGILCGRTSEGKRAWAQAPKGASEVLDSMMTEEWVGRQGKIVRREGKVNIAEFS